jgi:hypothetical protein
MAINRIATTRTTSCVEVEAFEMIWETNQDIPAMIERNESETDTVADLPLCVAQPVQEPNAKHPLVLIVSSAPKYRARLEKSSHCMGCRVVGAQCKSTALINLFIPSSNGMPCKVLL